MAKKILFVFGTRPEVIKMAPVINLANHYGAKIEPVVCVTAQHRHLLDQALKEFDIRPDIDLDLMRPNQTLHDIVSSVAHGIRDIYRKVRPSLVLLQGDTSTVFASALAAYYENIDVGHIEAGLRSWDIMNPFPEEVNRRFVSLVARYNFCPTAFAKKNLLSEHIDPKKIFITGNTVIDSLKEVLKRVRLKRPAIRGIGEAFLERPFILITGHRRENFGSGIRDICLAVRSLSRRYASLGWLWAVHLNPNARKIVFEILADARNIKLAEPLSYSEFVYLMDRSKFIISDSGGVQEEASFLGKRVLVTRACTERPEAVTVGTSILVGTNPERIIKNADNLLKRRASSMKIMNCPFGDGKAAKRIIDVVTKGRCQEFGLK